MKASLILSIIAITLTISCKSDREKENKLLLKENELLKKELELEKRENSMSLVDKNLNDSQELNQQKSIQEFKKRKDLNSDIAIFNNLFTDYESIVVSQNGDFIFDMGSASAGRIAGNLNDLTLRLEHLPERRGCADFCPEMILIHFNCKNGKKCISDPATPNYSTNSGTISIANIDLGKRSFNLLKKISDNLN